MASSSPRYAIHPSSNLFSRVCRLYVKARHLGYQRGQRLQHPSTSILSLEHVSNATDAKWYLGKHVAYVYRASKADKKGKKSRVIWGKVTRVHGNSGAVRAKFSTPLPPRTFGAAVRVMLYPSAI